MCAWTGTGTAGRWPRAQSLKRRATFSCIACQCHATRDGITEMAHACMETDGGGSSAAQIRARPCVCTSLSGGQARGTSAEGNKSEARTRPRTADSRNIPTARIRCSPGRWPAGRSAAASAGCRMPRCSEEEMDGAILAMRSCLHGKLRRQGVARRRAGAEAERTATRKLSWICLDLS